MIRQPKRLTSASAYANDFNTLNGATRATQPVSTQGLGLLTTQSPLGVTRKQIQPPITIVSSTPASSGVVMVLKITVVGLGDYFTAVPLYGAATPMSVAKPHYSRPSMTTQVWDGASFTLSYSDDSHRTSDNGLGTVQNEVCYPRIAVDGILLAMKSSNGTGIVGVDWIEVTPRIWQKAI